MEKKIKFRAWDSIRKEMIRENDLFADMIPVINFEGELMLFEIGGTMNAGDPENILKIMRWTGLNDRSGNPIFEDDIVEINEASVDEIHDGKVAIEQGQLLIVHKDYPDGFARIHDLIYDSEIDDNCVSGISIIGNIYENPDLLTKL